jgi:hypothetical protein
MKYSLNLREVRTGSPGSKSARIENIMDRILVFPDRKYGCMGRKQVLLNKMRERICF